jgi:hypothetical protein
MGFSGTPSDAVVWAADELTSSDAANGASGTVEKTMVHRNHQSQPRGAQELSQHYDLRRDQ